MKKSRLKQRDGFFLILFSKKKEIRLTNHPISWYDIRYQYKDTHVKDGTDLC